MKKIAPQSGIFGKKVNGVRVTPISLKITAIFILFLLASNFISNFINLTLNRGEQIKLTTELLVRDLKDVYVFSSSQYRIYKDSGQSVDLYFGQIEEYSRISFTNQKSVVLGISEDGLLDFKAGGAGIDLATHSAFTDKKVFSEIVQKRTVGKEDGAVEFDFNGERYFGVYRYHPDWKLLFIRAEEWNEFYEPAVRTFTNISLLIFALTLVSVLVGTYLIRYILRFVSRMTTQIMAMQQDQSMELIKLDGAVNDEISYLGVSINTLTSTINNLLNIFKKFVARDVAVKAYKEREIRLEGNRRELAIMFSDIKSFTAMTETLGTDIIKLLNLHYNQAISKIHAYNGDIGSIIGDAVLAVFGALPQQGENKSLQSVRAGFEVLAVADSLRKKMSDRRSELLKQRSLTESEERVYEAVLLEVGVGIDGGTVFYGNIGSRERMVNTVIGDNVNSSSRLEGLTRIYKVPMIVSEFIRDEVLSGTNEFVFLELDQVLVKGKTTGKRVYFPVQKSSVDTAMATDFENYSQALQFYYQGDWVKAHKLFCEIKFTSARLFEDRTRSKLAPSDWKGIWTMNEK